MASAQVIRGTSIKKKPASSACVAQSVVESISIKQQESVITLKDQSNNISQWLDKQFQAYKDNLFQQLRPDERGHWQAPTTNLQPQQQDKENVSSNIVNNTKSSPDVFHKLHDTKKHKVDDKNTNGNNSNCQEQSSEDELSSSMKILIQSYKVIDLRKELRNRNLDYGGLKKDLRKRLMEAVAEEERLKRQKQQQTQQKHQRQQQPQMEQQKQEQLEKEEQQKQKQEQQQQEQQQQHKQYLQQQKQQQQIQVQQQTLSLDSFVDKNSDRIFEKALGEPKCNSIDEGEGGNMKVKETSGEQNKDKMDIDSDYNSGNNSQSYTTKSMNNEKGNNNLCQVDTSTTNNNMLDTSTTCLEPILEVDTQDSQESQESQPVEASPASMQEPLILESGSNISESEIKGTATEDTQSTTGLLDDSWGSSSHQRPQSKIQVDPDVDEKSMNASSSMRCVKNAINIFSKSPTKSAAKSPVRPTTKQSNKLVQAWLSATKSNSTAKKKYEHGYSLMSLESGQSPEKDKEVTDEANSVRIVSKPAVTLSSGVNNSTENKAEQSTPSVLQAKLDARKAKSDARKARLAEMRNKSKPVATPSNATTIPKEFTSTLSSLKAKQAGTMSEGKEGKRKLLAAQMREKAAANFKQKQAFYSGSTTSLKSESAASESHNSRSVVDPPEEGEEIKQTSSKNLCDPPKSSFENVCDPPESGPQSLSTPSSEELENTIEEKTTELVRQTKPTLPIKKPVLPQKVIDTTLMQDSIKKPVALISQKVIDTTSKQDSFKKPVVAQEKVIDTTFMKETAPHPVVATSVVDLQSSASQQRSELLSPMSTYEISDREDSDSDESDSDDSRAPKKKIPGWARQANLAMALEKQYAGSVYDPDEIFPEVQTCDLQAIFDSKKAKYIRRTSTGNWTKDCLTAAEKLTYKRTMGYKKSKK